MKIEVIPGASALLTGLIGSGLHMHDFRFLGFLPLKKGRQTLLKSLKLKKTIQRLSTNLLTASKKLSQSLVLRFLMRVSVYVSLVS
jgi:16S rRNA C1402 (ribose-2'-O) methylase RsmI